MPDILFISDNPFKIREYDEQFRQYGITIETTPWLSDAAALEAVVKAWLIEPTRKKKSYALNEWSGLYNAETHQPTAGMLDMEPVYNKGELIAYFLDEAGELVQEHSEHRVYGYIDTALPTREGFDWDDRFVNAVTGKTYAESAPLWGKCSPRQLLLSDFIQQRLFYRTRHNLNFGDYEPVETVAFISLSEELNKNPLLGANRHLKEWGLDNFIAHAIQDGIHLRFAQNRREKNYWMPGLNGGLPAVSRHDAVHETTFRVHDLAHYGLAPVCDLLPCARFDPAAQRVYHAARMMSEAFSLVLADMLFVDSLKKMGVEYDYEARNIYPIFAALDIQSTQDIKSLKAVFKAITVYALLGDDAPLNALVPAYCSEGFKEWYGRFFTGDHLWTAQNFKNMAQQGDVYKEWRLALGDELFNRANLNFLDDKVAYFERQGVDAGSYPAVTEALFEAMFTRHVLPRLSAPPKQMSDEVNISNAFRRYMLGQALFYIRYKEIPAMAARAASQFEVLRRTEVFGADERDAVRREFKKDVLRAQAAHVITHDDRRIYTHVFPAFPPVYIDAYDKQEANVAGTVAKLFKEISK